MNEEECFNVESGEATYEFEEIMKSEAIGSTMYNKRWVLNAVLGICQSQDMDDTLDADFESLVEMSVDRDVAGFLLESGCAEMILMQNLQSEHDRIKELALCVVMNIIHHDDIFERIVGDERYFKVVFNSVFSDSPQVLIAFFMYMKLYCDKVLTFKLKQESDEDSLGENMETSDHITDNVVAELSSILVDQNIFCRLVFILTSSPNDEVLAQTSRFVLSVLELSCEFNLDDFYDTYSSAEFLSALQEALKQSINSVPTVFVIIEVFGNIVTEELIRPNSLEVLDLIASVIENHVLLDRSSFDLSCLDSVCMALKICHCSWTHVPHPRTLALFTRLVSKVEEIIEEQTSQQQSLEALRDSVIGSIRMHLERHKMVDVSEEIGEILERLKVMS